MRVELRTGQTKDDQFKKILHSEISSQGNLLLTTHKKVVFFFVCKEVISAENLHQINNGP